MTHVLYWPNLVSSKDKEKRKLQFSTHFHKQGYHPAPYTWPMYYTDQIWFHQRTKKNASSSFPLILMNKDNMHVLYWTNLVQSKDKEKQTEMPSMIESAVNQS